MAVSIEEKQDGKVLEVKVTGKLTAEDYRDFVPEFERLVQRHGKIRVLFEMSDFHGWEAGALWQDLKFDFRHYSDIERLGMVGESRWEEGMSKFCEPFTTAEIRYFNHDQADSARAWIEGV